MTRSTDAMLTARLELINRLVDDLARVDGSGTPVALALADRIKREVEAVRHALTRSTP
jgi:hypothetical protein